MKLSGLILSLLAASYLLQSCNKSSSDSDGAAASSNMNLAFPSSLVISSPTAQTTSASSSSFESNNYDSINVLSASATDNGSTKKAAIDKVITASSEADCSINVNLSNAGRATCYGPTISYTNHPDGSPTSGSLPGGDLGIWSASETSGEACSAAELNTQMSGVASQVDAGLYAMAGLICMSKVKGQSLPAVGQSLDLTSTVNGKITINGSAITVTAASLARESDTSDGHPVYVASITGSSYYFRLKHISTNSDNSTYKGKLSISTPNNDKTSIAYTKASATSVTYELKSANGSSVAWVSSTDYSVLLSSGWQNNANYLLANYDPTTFAGNYLYAWQAGSGDSHARVFNVSISGAESSQTGTAFFGFGPNMASSSGLGSISGMICNWAGSGNSHTPVNYVQKQTIVRSGTKFIAQSSYITYDPANSCDDNSSFSYTGPSGSTVNASSVTKNLVAKTEVASSITTPTVPSNVDQ